MIGFYDYTVIATYIGLISAVCGIYCAYCGNPVGAVVFLMLSGFCDMFDGKIAGTRKNRTRAEKRFGVQIDSLSDVVAFGVLPAFIFISYSGGSYICLGVAFLYVLTAVIRLAYYNVTEEERQDTAKENEPRAFYLGLPVTSSAVILPLIICFKSILGGHFNLFFGICMLLCALLFVTPFRLRKPKLKTLVILALIGILLLGFVLVMHFT